jgi:hypothetical protein
MFTAYIVATVVAAVMVGYSAYAVFTGAAWVVDNLRKYGVPESCMLLLGLLKSAGALGLLIGLVVPVVGSAAALGLVVYFLGAIVTVVRAHYWSHVAFPLAFLLPPAASLALLLITSDPVRTPVT